MESYTNDIKQRVSVRTFNGQHLSSEHLADLQQFISSLPQLFGAKVRIELLSVDLGESPVRLGTYGVITGTKSFLTLVVDDSSLALVAGGYLFEEVILHCTSLGIGTCWVGGTLRRGGFAKKLNIQPNEKLVAVSPVGYKKHWRKISETIMRRAVHSDRRDSFDSLYFENDFRHPLNYEKAGPYLRPLQMVRLGPSASNQQSWRVVKQDGRFDFYHHKASFSEIDLGIALCHFELTCKELGLEGSFKVLKDISSFENNQYVISWIL
jgi:nitroreductase